MVRNSVPSSMVDGLLTNLTLLFSLVTGTAALTLSLLTWRILRESAVGQTVVALTLVMVSFSFYHGIAFLFPQSELFASVLKSVTFTAVALFVAFSIRFEREVAPDDSPRGES